MMVWGQIGGEEGIRARSKVLWGIQQSTNVAGCNGIQRGGLTTEWGAMMTMTEATL